MKYLICDPLADLSTNAHHTAMHNWLLSYLVESEISLSFYEIKSKLHKYLRLIGWNLKLFFENPVSGKCEIWPNIDLISLFFLCIRVNIKRKDRYLVRFIGIQERLLIEKFPNTMKSLLRFLLRNGNCEISAESAYLHKLLESWGFTNNYLPFPPPHITSNFRILKQPYAFFPGNPRIDKGVEKLFDIAEVLKKNNLVLLVNFNTAEYLQKNNVKIIENLEVIPNSISNLELSKIIASSTFIVLPYDVNLYKYRGSGFVSWAIFSESMVLIEENSTMICDLELLNADYATINNSKIQLHLSRQSSNLDKLSKLKKDWETWLT